MSNEQRPLFSVGERVKLVSKSFPEFNGEYTVEEVLGAGEYHVCRFTEQTYRCPINFCYKVNQALMVKGSEGLIDESSLRKIYDTGEYSFDEIMDVLKSPLVS
jgi:hypothetical protein